MRLQDIGEDDLIARLTSGLRMDEKVHCGPGDDCAVLYSTRTDWLDLLKTDAVVEGVHFLTGEDPEAVGWKALARPTSDIAAMGGLPTAAVVTIIAARDLQVATVEGWYRGLQKGAEAFGVSVVGGETSATNSDSSVISVAMTGRVEAGRCIYRSGAKRGDAILVTGRLGGSLASGRHLNFTPRLTEARWLTGHFKLHALMDLSDGLAKDLPRMMKLSGTAFRVDMDSLPCHQGVDSQAAVGDGEDYELLFTLPQEQVPDLLIAWQKQFGDDPPLTLIGEVSAVDAESSESPASSTTMTTNSLTGGWEHFAPSSE